MLKVDGKEVATQQMKHTLPFIMQWDENLDIGSDTGSPVNDADYQPPFNFTGKLNKVTLTIDRPHLSPGGRQEASGGPAQQPGERVGVILAMKYTGRSRDRPAYLPTTDA